MFDRAQGKGVAMDRERWDPELRMESGNILRFRDAVS